MVMVRLRVLHRLLRRAYRVRGAFAPVPHRRGLAIHRDFLRRLVTTREVGIAIAELPRTVLVLERPSRSLLSTMDRETALRVWWRRLFHLKVHAELESPTKRAMLTQGVVRQRIDAIGQARFDEIRQVLRQDNLLRPGASALHEYVEFAALFLELNAFSPARLQDYFPDVSDKEAVLNLLRADLDPEALLQKTRPKGAPAAITPEFRGPPRPERIKRDKKQRTARWEERLRKNARRSSAKGNNVRAALRHQKAAAAAPDLLAIGVDESARLELVTLVNRLRSALHLKSTSTRNWKRSLEGILPPAVAVNLSVEARFLYDLQRVCLDHERGVSRFAFKNWAKSLGKVPLRQPVPIQRAAMLTRHLRSAADRLPLLHLAEEDREVLKTEIGQAARGAELRLRETCRPLIVDALNGAGLDPDSLVERVARDKLAEELLDRIVERGYLNLGELRDAVSRNQLKLDDCIGLKRFRSASSLLTTDRALEKNLPGVHRRGEVYLRWLQRLSALGFGTKVGRFLTLYALIPYGGAFVILEGLQHLLHVALKPFGVQPQLMDSYRISLIMLGTLLLLMMHSLLVRRAAASLARKSWEGVRSLASAPLRWLRHPKLRRLLRRRWALQTWRWLIRPVIAATLIWPLVLIFGRGMITSGQSWSIAFFACFLWLISPLGRLTEEWLSDVAWRLWRGVRGTLVKGLFRWIVVSFQALVDFLEQLVYGVDEWLRFRTGDQKYTVAFKAVGSLVWSVVSYIARITINLFLEPQVNPVKHFPVVTVSHKMLLPMQPLLANLVSPLGVGEATSQGVAAFIVLSTPGFFGFLVWELKENWRLFQANRAPTLKPVIVGSHGETMLRLMRPGFHSGTLPKAFGRLRGAERDVGTRAASARARKERRRIHHVETEVKRFVNRELIAYLHETRAWRGRSLKVGEVEAGSNQIRIYLSDRDHGFKGPTILFEEQSGNLIASLATRGWLRGLPEEERQVFRTALAGLYAHAGVDLVREQIQTLFGPEPPPYDVADVGLLLWPGDDYLRQVEYPITRAPELVPTENGEVIESFPTLPRRSLFFGENPIPWAAWVAVWDAAESGTKGPIIHQDHHLLNLQSPKRKRPG